MKRLIINFLLFMTVAACQNDKKESNEGPSNAKVNNPESVGDQSESLNNKICIIEKDDNKCQLTKNSLNSLSQLSHSGIMPESVLDLNEIIEIYQLNKEMVDCLKQNFCKELN